MKKQNIFKASALFSSLILLFLLVYMFLPHRRGREAEQVEIDFVITVNDSGNRAVDASTPLYIQCVISNLSEDRDVLFFPGKSVKPVFTDENDRRMKVKTQIVPVKPTRISPLGALGIAWTVKSRIPEGTYSVSLSDASGCLKAGKGVLKNVRLHPARLVVSRTPVPEKTKEYYSRRLLAVEGKHSELIGRLKNTLSEAPGNVLMRLELVDAYENAGEYELAYRELMRMGYEAQESAKRNGQGEVPCWIPLRAGELKRKMFAD